MGYHELDVPEEKDPEEYNYHERRAELLQFAIQAGHPDKISPTAMGDRYDVAKSTITKDMNKIADEIHENLNSDAEMVTSVIYRKVIRELMDNGNHMEAIEVLESWNGWLFDMGKQSKAADKLEIEGDPGEAYMAMLKEASEDDE